jgi:hypothetical protein
MPIDNENYDEEAIYIRTKNNFYIIYDCSRVEFDRVFVCGVGEGRGDDDEGADKDDEDETRGREDGRGVGVASEEARDSKKACPTRRTIS